MNELLKKIKQRKAKIAVIGMGYVGLPLAVNFAKKGFKVFGLDKDLDRVNRLKKNESYILDIASREISDVTRCNLFSASTDFSVLKEANVIIICVPTPLKRKYTPDISYIVEAVKTTNRFIEKGCLVVLESTTYPGTTDELVLPVLATNRKKPGKDFYLAFSPERIDPGNKKYDVTRIPKLVGGVDKISGILTKELYSTIIKEVHLLSSAKAAEMAKLLENSFRIINIGWINEVAMMCQKLKIDVWEVIDAAKTKPFGFMPFYPGLGVGGHCIPDDPLYLYWKAKHHGFSSKFIKLSADINSNMPSYVVGRLEDLFTKGKNKRLKVLIIGVTYKKDVKDLRKAPPLTLIEILQSRNHEAHYFDPIIPYLNIRNINLKSIHLTKEHIKQYDCVVIATDHTDVNYKLIEKNAKLIFDARNVYTHSKSKNIIKL